MTQLKKKSWTVEIMINQVVHEQNSKLGFFQEHGYKNPSLEYEKNKKPSLGFEKRNQTN